MLLDSSLNLLILILILLVARIGSNSINGGTYLALTGKDSVILATDSRFSSHQLNSFLLGKYPRNIFRIGSRSLLGCIGLEADSYVLVERLKSLLANHFDDEINPENIARLVATLLYENGFYLTTIVTGLSKTGDPYICSFDGLGAQTTTKDFAVIGTSNAALLSLMESNYEPNLSAERLCVLAEKCLKLAFQRDILSGSDLRIVTLRRDGIYQKSVSLTDV